MSHRQVAVPGAGVPAIGTQTPLHAHPPVFQAPSEACDSPPAADMDERKAALIEALAAKCAALLELPDAEKATGAGTDSAAAATSDGQEVQPEAADKASEAQDGANEAFHAAFRELRKWVDTAADEKVRSRWHQGPKRMSRPDRQKTCCPCILRTHCLPSSCNATPAATRCRADLAVRGSLLCCSTSCCMPSARCWRAGWPPLLRSWIRWAQAELAREPDSSLPEGSAVRREPPSPQLVACRQRPGRARAVVSAASCTQCATPVRPAVPLRPALQAASSEDTPAPRDVLELRASLLAQARLDAL